MEHLGTFGFNGVRFALGAAALVPLAARQRGSFATAVRPGVLMGAVLFAGSSLQQAGIGFEETGAGDAGFITGLYVVLVPILGIALGKRTHFAVWIGAALTLVGLYFLSVQEGLKMSRGDTLVLIGAFCWAIHILMIDRFTEDEEPLHLSVVQFATCSVLSLAAVPLVGEVLTRSQVVDAWLPILYCGLFATALGFTLQVVAQKYAHPSTAGVLLSGEVVFAAMGGWVLLGERMGGRSYFGAALMLVGMLVAQEPWRRARDQVTRDSDGVTK